MARLITPRQAAEAAGVSVNLVYQWTTGERRLTHYRCGGKGRRGRILIDEADLLAFLETLKVKAGGGPAPAPRAKKPAPLRHLTLD